jgi:predicted transcriptional regulator
MIMLDSNLAEKFNSSGKESSAGKSLKRIFRQDENLKKIENQPASISMLMNSRRMDIFLHLCQNPCDHTRSIARKMGENLTAVNWHLGQLFQKGYIESANIKGKRVYWPTGMVMPGDVEMVKTLRNGWALQIFKAISESEVGARQKSIVIKMQEIQQNVNVWLEIMTSVGLLEKVGQHMGTRYRIPAKMSEKVAEYDNTAKQYSETVLSTLKNDGLMPNKSRLRGSRLSVNVKLPFGTKKVSIECNPLAPLKGVLKNKKS